ncbi:hypothetical protein CMO96_02465 [Candidatus Woesebacteria bacterium]|nr:hypothetical protein [Candidatus Woesebacteria bacterium]|tara:strand:- start:188 stop:937 length:750 start_codon:yes stop_codon:yes gene_type:complete
MKISVVVITKNSEEKIEDSLKSAKGLAGEILVLDGGSTDKTLEIVKKHNARIIAQRGKGYSSWRNQGIKESHGDWIFYLDSDERVTPELIKEMLSAIGSKPTNTAYAIPRKNVILGREMKHGGWWPDYVKRLFRRDALKEWKGDLHEEPVFQGEMGHLKNPMIHLKHDNLSEMVEKTNQWSKIEAKLLLDANHPKMSWWRFFRIMFTELWYRLIVKRGFLDGGEGVVYAIYQMWSKFLTYGKLWEMQKK